MEIGAKFDPSAETEDALSYLPRKPVTTCRKGQRIFDEQHPSGGLHLVVRGRVKLSIPVEAGTESIIDIFSTDDFFGESALLGAPLLHPRERTRVCVDCVCSACALRLSGGGHRLETEAPWRPRQRQTPARSPPP